MKTCSHVVRNGRTWWGKLRVSFSADKPPQIPRFTPLAQEIEYGDYILKARFPRIYFISVPLLSSFKPPSKYDLHNATRRNSRQ